MDRRGQSQVAQLRLGSGNYSIYEGVNTVGRNRDATVNIKNMNISQHHAIIVVHKGEHHISDLNSVNNSFCEGTKMEPYKLYELRNRIEITLGGLNGIYVTNAAFFEGDKPSHSTTLASQTFYGSDTQLLENSVEDIHETPTQEISWTNIKSTRDASNSNHRSNNDDSVLEETSTVLKKSINHNQSESTNDCQVTDIHKSGQDRMSFFEAETQVFDIRQTIQNKSHKSDSNETDKVVNTNDNMTDCKEASPQKCDNLKITKDDDRDSEENKDSSTSKCQKLDNVGEDNENLNEIIEIPVCENAPASTGNCKILDHAIPTKDKQNSDDEITDCEEDIEQPTTSTSGCQKLVNVETVKEKQDKNTDAEDDELTDCEEDALSSNLEIIDKITEKSAQDGEMTDAKENNKQKPNITSQTNKATVCEANQESDSNDSNDSMNFFKADTSNHNNENQDESSVFLGFDNSFNPSASDEPSIVTDNRNTDKSDQSNIVQDKQITDKSIIVQDNQDSDDDSITTFASNKKKRSLMVLSTQDFHDSYMENQMKKSTVNMDADDDIPETQTLNESDCVPGTQQINNARPYASQNANRLSIYKAKSQAAVTMEIEPCGSKDTSLDDLDFVGPTQKIETSFTRKHDAVPSESENMSFDDSDFFVGPTQKIETSFTRKNKVQHFESKNTNLDDTDFFTAPTQKIVASPSNINKKHDLTADVYYNAPTQKIIEEDDVFVSPTQKLTTNSSINQKLCSAEDTQEIYNAATQKMHLEDDSFLEPTQTLTRNRPQSKSTKTELHVFEGTQEIYDVPTQKITQQDNIFLSPTLSLNMSKKEKFKSPLGMYDAPNQNVASTEDEGIVDDAFIEPTQKLNSTECDKNKFDVSIDIFDVSTQKVPMEQKEAENINGDDTFSAPTQKVNDTGRNDDEKKHRKSYTKDKKEEIAYVETPRKRNSNESMESANKTSQNAEKKKTFSFKKSHLDATISDLAETKTNNESDVVEERKIEKLTIKKKDEPDNKIGSFKKSHLDATISDLAETKTSNKTDEVEETKIEKLTIKKKNESGNKIEKLTIKVIEPDNVEDHGLGGLNINAKEVDNIKETKTKKRAIKKAIEPDNLEENKIEKRSRKKAENSNIGEPDKIEQITLKRNKESAKIEKLTIKKEKKIDTVENNKIEELAVKKDGKYDKDEVNKIEKLTIKRPKEPVDKTKIEKPSIEKDNQIDNVENNKIEKLTIRSSKQSANIVDAKIEELTIKRDKQIDNVEDNKIEKLTIKKSISTKNPHKILNSGEHLIPKFLTENSSNIIDIERTSFNASNSEQNKSLALLESKFNKTKKSANPSEEIKVIVPKNRRSKSIASIEELQQEPPKRASKTTAKKTPQEVPAKKIAKNDNEGKESSVSGRKTKVTRKIAELESESKPCKQATKNSEETAELTAIASTSNNNLTSVSENNLGDRKSKTTRGKNRTVEEANNNDDGASKKSRAGTSRSTKSKRMQSTDDDDAGVGETARQSKKQRLQSVPDSPGTALRGLRKQRPKVVFTMMESPKLESLIKQLGGSVVDSVEACTVLITEQIKRTQKLLTAIGLGKPICSPNWITDSKKMHEFLDPWDYILTDPEAEKKWSFSLKESLTISRDLQLLRSYSFFIQVTNGVEVLKGAIESCGGKILPKIPATPSEGTYIISCPENRSKYSRILKNNPDFKVLEAEAIFDGVLRQELRFDRHLLK